MSQRCFFLLLILTGPWWLIASCNKETFITDPSARIQVSADTIRFDTVFTNTGSITQAFKVFNDNNQKLKLSSIRLMGGTHSFFRMNVNGIPTNNLTNLEIAANDSIYIYVSALINGNSQTNPFIIKDSIAINWNENETFVQLEAYGQNAHYLNNQHIQTDTVWNNDLPYVITGSLIVAEGATLEIKPGCKIYTHSNTPFFIDGTLKIIGEKNNEVIFRGDRLDEYYRDIPGSWNGIHFGNNSKNNQLIYTQILNADTAIHTHGPSVNTTPKLRLQQCIIDNAMHAGIFSKRSSIEANNILVSNCGKNVEVQEGGDYQFINCTMAAYSNTYMLHRYPVLILNDFSFTNGGIITAAVNANFTNCIFWGEGGLSDDEISINKEGMGPFNVQFDHCLYKAVAPPNNAQFQQSLQNTDPLFDSIDITHHYYDFRTRNQSLAPGIDQGINTPYTHDLDDLPRNIGAGTDLGCYEKQ